MRADIKHLFESLPCNLCGVNNFKVIYPAKYENETQKDLIEKFRAAGDETLIDQIVQCKRCGFIYVNPRIKSKMIVQGYSEGSDETHVGQAKGREITFAKSLKLINKYRPRKGKILDIGTAGGSFLYVAKKNGWDVHGIEPNKWMAEWGYKHYGIKIKAGELFDHKYPNEYFDVVTLWDVLEHVPNAAKVLDEVSRILKPGGLIVVNYPDIGSWIAKVLGRKWMFLLSVHLYYFTPRTIRIMLKKHGYRTLKIKPHFQSLALGYLIHRTKGYNALFKLAANIAEKFINILKWENKQVSYWIGQTLVIARKK